MSWEFPKYSENFNWDELAKEYSWVADMTGVHQDKNHHAEGDVDVHTGMVLDEAVSSKEFKELQPEGRHIMFTSVLMHDIEKRSTTTVEDDGKITSPGHAKKGAFTARTILYKEIPTPFVVREKICNLIKLHSIPLWAAERDRPDFAVIKSSILSNNKMLNMLATFDAKGRTCADQDELLIRIEMFKEICEEQGCFDKPYEFKTDLARFNYLTGRSDWAGYVPFDDTKFDVVIMSGLPGSGKDEYIKKNFAGMPIVSIDDIRREMKVKPTDKHGNGQAVQAAKEKARSYMRKHISFVWNATNITRDMRQQVINLCKEYGAFIRIVYIEVPYKELIAQNKDREYAVPEKAIQKLILKLDIPTVTEAHQVTYIIK